MKNNNITTSINIATAIFYNMSSDKQSEKEKKSKLSEEYINQEKLFIPINENYTMQEISEYYFEKLCSLNQELTFNYAEMIFKNSNISFRDFQKREGIVGKDNLYTNLGLLLSDQCAHTLKVSIFEGKGKETFKDEKEFKGSLLKQFIESFDYISLLNKAEGTVKGISKKDEKICPIEAIKEVLLNAIIHRKYSFGGSTLVNIYEDRIEFLSLGEIVSELSLDAIMLGISQPRNEKLANVFSKLSLTKICGIGIPKIFSIYEKYNIKPTINFKKGIFQVILPKIDYNSKVKENIKEQLLPLSDEHKKIINFLGQGLKSRKEIQEYTELGQTKTTIKLRELSKLGIIRKIGGGKNIKYCKN